MADTTFEVIIDGGGPWGFRLQGGKDFGIPLNIARVTPGSKAAMKQMNAGDFISEINGVNTDNLSHMEAQNLVKGAGLRLQLKIRKGKASPKVLPQTTVVHSANVDHGFNSKPRAFGGASSPVPQPAVSSRTPPPAPTVHATKFDPGAYARRKKEELEQRKKDQNVVVEDSEILKMINATSISKAPSPPPPESVEEHGQPGGDPGAFRMVYSGRDIHEEASPGSKSVISSLKEKVSQDKSGLNSESKVPSRAFQMLQKQLDDEEFPDLPPPPPEMFAEEESNRPSFGAGPGQQSRTFRHLQESVDSGEGHQSVFSKPSGERNKAVAMPARSATRQSQPQVTTVNAIPKPPMPTGPNFKISSPKAPTFNAQAAAAPPQHTYRPAQYANPQAPSSYSNSQAPSSAPSTAPSFKPSTVPQPVNSPQTTVGKVASVKQQMPADPSRMPVCHGCNDQIRGPFVSAIGKTWHPDHFCCDSCHKSLQNQGFVEEADKLYCEQCFNSYFAPKCASCGNSIIGNCINAVGKTYHPEHFRCEECSKNFANEGFLIEMGKPYCEGCHDKTFGVKCAGCNRSITGGQRYVEALSQNWHTDCFKCQACSVRLEGASFYVVKTRPFCGLHKAGL